MSIQGCFTEYSCKGFKGTTQDKCLEAGDCDLMVKYKLDEDDNEMEVHWHGRNLEGDEEDRFVAVGISKTYDKKKALWLTCNEDNIESGWYTEKDDDVDVDRIVQIEVRRQKNGFVDRSLTGPFSGA